jgi:hypothetical protein
LRAAAKARESFKALRGAKAPLFHETTPRRNITKNITKNIANTVTNNIANNIAKKHYQEQ